MDRYEEALEKARAGKSLEEIFPELKESEDERVRKALISLIYENSHTYKSFAGIALDSMLAYLEKRKEYVNDLSPEQDAYLTSERFKQAEKEKDEFTTRNFLQCLVSFDKFREGEHYWLEYVGGDMYVGRSDNILGEKFHITPKQLFSLFYKLEVTPEFQQDKQKPAEWSEGDEKMRGTCIDLLEHFPRPCGEVIGPWKDCIAWLKSLKNRGNSPKSNTNSLHWKPSEEQMSDLWRAATMNTITCPTLKSLYEDLKKL